MTIATTDVTNSATTVFTSSGNNAITFASFCNIHSGAVDIDIHVVPNGESVANSTLVIKDLTINAGSNFSVKANKINMSSNECYIKAPRGKISVRDVSWSGTVFSGTSVPSSMYS